MGTIGCGNDFFNFATGFMLPGNGLPLSIRLASLSVSQAFVNLAKASGPNPSLMLAAIMRCIRQASMYSPTVPRLGLGFLTGEAGFVGAFCTSADIFLYDYPNHHPSARVKLANNSLARNNERQDNE